MVTRRDFFEKGTTAVVAGGFASLLSSAEAAAAPVPAVPPDYYDKLGVARIINAAGTYTYLTASTMPPEVLAAVAEAARSPVRLRDLQKAAGAYLAGRLQCESAMVTCGAASALTIGTAAALTVATAAAPVDIPARVGTRNQVLIQKAHRFSHDHALEMAGVQLVEVTTAAEYEAAFSDRTAMAFYFNAAEGGEIGREEWIRIAHGHGVACFNDAAADVPPIANLWNYTKMGFDLVCFSGGKGMRGPQNAGLLLGRKDLIEAAAANNVPNDQSVGRGMKVAKEQIVGMVAAVDWFLAQTDAGIESQARARAARIVNELKGVPGLATEVVVPPVANHVPHLMIRYDRSRVSVSPLDVARLLREGSPSIELNPATGRASGAAGLHSDEHTIVVGVWMLQEGEDQAVGRRLKEVLTTATSQGERKS